MNGSRTQRGFTLIEVMAVVVIIATLAAIAMNIYGNYVTRSKVQAAKSDLTALARHLENELRKNLVYGSHSQIGTMEIMGDYPGWRPSQIRYFTYTLHSEPTGYTLRAQGMNGSLSTCVLTLDSTETGDVSGHCGSVATW